MAILRNGVNTHSKHANIKAVDNAAAISTNINVVVIDTQYYDDNDPKRGLFLLDDETFIEKYMEALRELAKDHSKEKKYVYRWFAYTEVYNSSGLDLDKLYFIASNDYEMMLSMLKASKKFAEDSFLDIEWIESGVYCPYDNTYEVDTNNMKAIVKYMVERYNDYNDCFWFEKFEAICP